MLVINSLSIQQMAVMCIAAIETKLEEGGVCLELNFWELLRQCLEAQLWPTAQYSKAVNHFRNSLASYFQG